MDDKMEWKYLLCRDRIRPSSGGGDLRSEFEKDYHRIIGSASFRRLQDKTQVFPLNRIDFVRTRLTHSLEVSSFGKSLGQSVSGMIINNIKDKSFLPEYSADVCDILACAGLIHDIGNPPFGHFGESVIRKWFKENLSSLKYRGARLTEILSPERLSDLLLFDGNAQGFRLVTKLHYIIDCHGMNLTKGLLSAVVKYPPAYGKTGGKKKSIFYADRDTYNDIDSALKTKGRRNPLDLSS